jgi:hypothetical protein
MKLKELPIILEEGNIVALWENAKDVEYHIVTSSKENKTALISYSKATSWDFLKYFIEKNIDYHKIIVYDKVGKNMLTGGDIIYDSENEIKDGDVVHTYHEQFFRFKEWINKDKNLARVYFGYSIMEPDDFSYREVIIDGKASVNETEAFYKNIEKQGYVIINNQLTLKYPTDFQKCLEILNLSTLERPIASGYKYLDIEALQRLIVFRDAWWRLYGEDFPKELAHTGRTYYCIYHGGNYLIDEFSAVSHVLALPTRDLAVKFKDAFINDIKAAGTLI